jgi:hypothetical protein
MNAGFSNLATLKANVLAPALVASTDYDARLLAIGLGVAKSFDNYCNREFTYGEGVLEVFSGDRPFWFARRSPVSVFTKVELRFFRGDAWTDISGQPLSADEEKGLIHFGYTLGRNPIQVRLTYTGGYFWEQKEPTDAGYPTATPTAITSNTAGLDPNKFLLPADLQFAFFMQVRKVWEAIDKIGDKISEVGSNARQTAEVMAGLDLIPEVRAILDSYKRYQLT